MKNERINVVIRMDTALKKQADALFKELGLDLPTAIDVFLRQSIRENGFPFLIQNRNFRKGLQHEDAEERFADAPIRAETHEVPDIASGISGGVTWRIDAKGTLTLSPTDGVSGTMTSLSGFPCGSPWYSYRTQVKKAVAEPGVVLGFVASHLFYGCSNLIEVDLNNLDVSNVTDMSYMFFGCSKLTSLEGLADWQTGSVTNMSTMFEGCSSLTSLEGLANWQTESVEDMSNMFNGCSSLTSLEPLANWQTGNVTNMSYMFWECSSLTSLDGLDDWQTANVGDMSYMFSWCSKLTSLYGLADWQTGNVTDVRGMFYNCSNLASLEGLTEWDTGKVKYMSDIFSGCSRLTFLKLPANWQIGNVKDMKYMFNSCSKAESADFSNWILPTSSDTKGGMLNRCSSLSEITVSSTTDLSDTRLPGPQATDIYTGYWTYGNPYNHDPEDILTHAQFRDGGTHKAGTWYWERKGNKA